MNITFDLFIQSLCRYLIQFRQVTIEHDLLTPGKPAKAGDLHVTCFPTPTGTGKTARPNYAYHFDTGKKRVTYASDLKTLPEKWTGYFQDNDLLVVDGAGWDKDLPNHRGALNHLQDYVAANNARIVFTDIGRAAPPHTQANEAVQQFYAGAEVAFDFMKIPLGR